MKFNFKFGNNVLDQNFSNKNFKINIPISTSTIMYIIKKLRKLVFLRTCTSITFIGLYSIRPVYNIYFEHIV